MGTSTSGNDDPASILVVLPTWVGDFVMATPTLRALRNRFPNSRIIFLAEPNLRELIRDGDWMDECIEWPVKSKHSPFHFQYVTLIRRLRERRFDCAVLFPNSFRAALVARLAGAKRRLGYDRDGRGWLLNDRLQVRNRQNGQFVPMPLVEYFAELAEAIGCRHPGHETELFTSAECDSAVERRLSELGIADQKPLVVISPALGMAWPNYGLPAASPMSPTDLLIRTAPRSLSRADRGKENIALSINAEMKQQGFVLHDPLLTLGELKSLTKRSDLLLCTDAGPRHIGKAFGVPVVTVFGPTHPEWTATNYPKERIVRIDVDCGPCQQRVCPFGHHKCMRDLSPDLVYNAAVELLGHPMHALAN